jgi:diguanylate cyclase (GGDEF)-like protein/PAS domain S-box-containing protein
MPKKKPLVGKARQMKHHALSKPKPRPVPKKKTRPSPAQGSHPLPSDGITPKLESDLLHVMMDNTTDRIYFKDTESRFILMNRSTAVWLGLGDPSEAVGKTDFDFFSDEHARQAYIDEKQIMASDQPFVGMEEKETWPDGRVTWVSTTKIPLRDRKGRVFGTFGISRDITELKLGEEARIRAAAMRESMLALEKANAALQAEVAERRRAEEELAYERRLFQTMMESTTDRIYFKDKESRFLLINRAQARKFGLGDPSEAVGKTDFDFFSDEHARQAFTDEKQIMTSDQPFVGMEEKETWPDGHETWASSTKFPMRDQEGQIVGTFGISRDITERKAIEKSILQTNEELEKTNTALGAEIIERRRVEDVLAHESTLFRTLMDNTTDHIYFKDKESRFLLINRAQADEFGLSDPAESVGKTDFDFFSDEHARQAFTDEKQIMAGGKPLVNLEEKETWPDGHETWVSSTKFPMSDREGRLIGTFGISRNISERKAMEISIQLANEKLSGMVNWLEGRNRDISVLSEMGNMLEACRSIKEAYPIISSQMGKLLPVHTGKLYRFDGERRRLDTVASWGIDPGHADSFSPEECKAIQSGQVCRVEPGPSGSDCAHRIVPSGEDISYVCIPLISQGETIGVIHLCGEREKGADVLPEMNQQLAIMAADHITLALANLTLRETLRVQSIRDSLTGLFNRRYLDESLRSELARTKRRGTLLGVIMLDVDRFKQINDTFGHEAGDTLLQGLGRWLQANIRAGDISCRYGGDEFVLILPDASLEATTQRAQQICEGIRALTIEHQGRSMGAVSVSIGVAGFPLHGETRDALLAAVDAALYKAKEQGRNTVVVAGE